MDKKMISLQRRWDKYAQHTGLPVAFASGVWQLITALHKIPPRAYHSLEWHIAHMLDDFYEFNREHPKFTEGWNEIEWAIWFHDIYHGNEVRSADLAVALLHEHTKLNPYKVSWNIWATTHCLKETYGPRDLGTLTPENRLMCDLDLKGFVAPEEIFRESQERIRKEYPQFSDAEYAKGRKEFMEKLLGRGYVFILPEFKHLEQQAVERIQGIMEGKYD